MVKVVLFLKKKEGMSSEEFRDYCETKRVKLFEEARDERRLERWVRRYLTPVADPVSGELRSSGFDVITEVWCSEERFEASFGRMLEPEFRALIAQDEVNLFDQSQIFIHAVEDVDSDKL